MTSALRWGWVVSTMPLPLYPRERPGTHCTGGWVGPRAGLDGCGTNKIYKCDRGPRVEEPCFKRFLLEGVCPLIICRRWTEGYICFSLVLSRPWKKMSVPHELTSLSTTVIYWRSRSRCGYHMCSILGRSPSQNVKHREKLIVSVSGS